MIDLRTLRLVLKIVNWTEIPTHVKHHVSYNSLKPIVYIYHNPTIVNKDCPYRGCPMTSDHQD